MKHVEVEKGPVGSLAQGWASGFVGMLIFSGSLPATRAAVIDFDPVFLTAARAAIAALCGALPLILLRQRLPSRGDLGSLVIAAFGVVIGFPLFTAFALRHIDASHSIVFTGLLPLATAGFAVLRGGERPAAGFWVFALLGSALVAGYALFGSTARAGIGDLLMLLAILVCGLGYAEGAVLSRRLGGWQVICWALLVALPVALLGLGLMSWPRPSAIGASAWLGLGYVSLFSMLIGFMFWYRGLALGGIAAVGQLQLLQPLFGLALAALLLGESIGSGMIGVTIGVIICVAGARRFSTARPVLSRSIPQ